MSEVETAESLEHSRKRQKTEENAEGEHLTKNSNGEVKSSEDQRDDSLQKFSEEEELSHRKGEEKLAANQEEKKEVTSNQSVPESSVISSTPSQNQTAEESSSAASSTPSEASAAPSETTAQSSVVSSTETAVAPSDTVAAPVEQPNSTTSEEPEKKTEGETNESTEDYSEGIKETIPAEKFDPSRIMDLSGGDKEFENELITMFRDNITERIPQLHEVFAKQDDHMCRHYSHEIKGSAASIGAESLRFITEKMEFLSKDAETAKESGDQAKCNDLLKRAQAYMPFLEVEYELTCKVFDEYLA